MRLLLWEWFQRQRITEVRNAQLPAAHIEASRIKIVGRMVALVAVLAVILAMVPVVTRMVVPIAGATLTSLKNHALHGLKELLAPS